MNFTSFRTITMPLLGTRAVRVAGAAPYPQRVLLVPRTTAPATRIFVTSSTNELDNAAPAAAIVGGAAQVIADFGGTVFALAPGQALFAATNALGPPATPTTLSVSVSALVPYAGDRQPYKTTFRSYTMPGTGTNAAIRIVPAAELPRRVHIMPGALATNVRIAQSAEELNPFGPFPAGAFRFDEANGPITFVAAPRQAIYATVDPGSAGALLAVSVSDIYAQPPVARFRQESQTKTITLIEQFTPVRIAPANQHWRRVLVLGDPSIVIGSAANDMTIPFQLVPVVFNPGAFSFLSQSPVSVILPPHQPLYAATGATVAATVQAHVSEALFDSGELG